MDALKEYNWLKHHCFFSTRGNLRILNLRFLIKHVSDVPHGYKCLKNDVIWFTETKRKPSDSTFIVGDTLKNINTSFNSNYDESVSLACEC